MLIDIISSILMITGGVFFLLGTLGLIRFPDLLTRLHALTKAENVGLAFIVLGLACQSESIWQIAKIGLIWLLIQVAAASVAHIIASTALDQNEYDKSCKKL